MRPATPAANAALLAVQFLTRLPVRRALDCAPAALGCSALWYPAVGALLGVLVATAAALARPLGPGVAAVLALVVWVLVTGALHLDGLADTADAYVGGGSDRARILAILKDPRCGPMGVVAIGLVLLGKHALLAALLAHDAYAPLVLAPVLGRAALLGWLLVLPPARPGGLAAAVAVALPHRRGRVLLAVLALAILLAGGAYALLAGGLVAGLWGRHQHARLGGCTGDTLGAGCELVETATLLSGLIALA